MKLNGINQHLSTAAMAVSLSLGLLSGCATPAPSQSVSILEPTDGATVSPTFKVRFGVRGMNVAPAGEIITNSGHNHLLINKMPIPKGESVPFDDQHKHLGAGRQFCLAPSFQAHRALSFAYPQPPLRRTAHWVGRFAESADAEHGCFQEFQKRPCALLYSPCLRTVHIFWPRGQQPPQLINTCRFQQALLTLLFEQHRVFYVFTRQSIKIAFGALMRRRAMAAQGTHQALRDDTDQVVGKIHRVHAQVEQAHHAFRCTVGVQG